MSAPEIDIRWGGEWKRSDKRYVAPIVGCTVDLAREGLDHFDIPIEQPKIAIVSLCGRAYMAAGESVSSTTFELHYRAVDVKRKKVFNSEQRRKHNVGTAFHELLHSARLEFCDEQTVEELIAAEGIAYVGTELLMNELGAGRHFSSIPIPSTSGQYSFAKQYLAEELVCDIDTHDGELEPLHERWLQLRQDGAMPEGIFLGCVAVSDVLNRGALLKDVMQMDAREILGL